VCNQVTSKLGAVLFNSVRQLLDEEGSLVPNSNTSALTLIAELLMFDDNDATNEFLDAFFQGLESGLSNDGAIFRNIAFVVELFRAWPQVCRKNLLTRLGDAITRWMQTVDEDRLLVEKYCRSWEAILSLYSFCVQKFNAPQALFCFVGLDSPEAEIAFLSTIQGFDSEQPYRNSENVAHVLGSFLHKLSTKLLTDDFPNKRQRGSDVARIKRIPRTNERESANPKRKRGAETVTGDEWAALRLFITLSNVLCKISPVATEWAFECESLVDLHVLKHFLTFPLASTESTDSTESKLYAKELSSLFEQAQNKLTGECLHLELLSCAIEAVVVKMAHRVLEKIDHDSAILLTSLCSLLESLYRVFISVSKELLESLELSSFHELVLSNSHPIIFNGLAFSKGPFSLLPPGSDAEFPSLYEASLQVPSQLNFSSSLMEGMILKHFAHRSSLQTKLCSLKYVFSACLTALSQVWEVYLAETALFRNCAIATRVMGLYQLMENNRFFEFVQPQVSQLIQLGFNEISTILPLTNYVRTCGPICTREWIHTQRTENMILDIVQFLSTSNLTDCPPLSSQILERCFDLMKVNIASGNVYLVFSMRARETGKTVSDIVSELVFPLFQFTIRRAGSSLVQCIEFLVALGRFGGELNYGLVRALMRLESADFDYLISTLLMPTRGEKPLGSFIVCVISILI